MSGNTCVIVGASHGGVNCAFELRKQGFNGDIVLIDKDPQLPYHRPPLSKAFLLGGDPTALQPLKAQTAYAQSDIDLKLGTTVESVDVSTKQVKTSEGTIDYGSVVLATGATPFIPPISGLSEAKNSFVLRDANDATDILAAVQNTENTINHVVVVGAGYIGLEAAASLSKLGAKVTVVEREQRILQRVASESLSTFMTHKHSANGIEIVCQKTVSAVKTSEANQLVVLDDDTELKADMIIVGVGVRVNTELAQTAGVETLPQGIVVDAHMNTSISNIYAVGDCTVFPHPTLGDKCHIESVQNAVGQARIVAQTITGKVSTYDEQPWFWSDQFDAKLQSVGLPKDADNILVREEGDNALSVWHFDGEALVCVEAINAPKAYVLGGRWIAKKVLVDKEKLADANVAIKDCEL